MKKIQLKLGKEMLSKEQMKKVGGGDDECLYWGDYYHQWWCCASPPIYMGTMTCSSAAAWCQYDDFSTSEAGCLAV